MKIIEINLNVFRIIFLNYLTKSEKNTEMDIRVLEIYKKIKPEMAASFLTNAIVDLYVKNIDKFIENPEEEMHIQFGKLEKVHLIWKYLLDNPTLEKGTVYLAIHKKDIFEYECNEYLHYLMSTIRMTKNKQRDIHFPKLDSILSDTPKRYAKHARKSVTQTLLKINQQKKLRPKYDNDGMLPYKKVNKYKDFGEKYIACYCPICRLLHEITMKNIDDIVSITKAGEATLKCKHNNSFLEKMPYRISIKNYLPNHFDEQTAKVYFLLNLGKLSELEEVGKSIEVQPVL